MTYSEFIHRRKSSTYKVGDKVWFYNITGFTSMGAKTEIQAGVVIYTEDDYSAFYGVRPLDTAEDTYCEVRVLKTDMRKFRKKEVIR